MCSCETSFGSIFLFEIGASVDGAPVVYKVEFWHAHLNYACLRASDAGLPGGGAARLAGDQLCHWNTLSAFFKFSSPDAPANEGPTACVKQVANFPLPSLLSNQADTLTKAQAAAAEGYLSPFTIPLLAEPETLVQPARLNWVLRFPLPPSNPLSNRRFSSTPSYHYGPRTPQALDAAVRYAANFSYDDQFLHTLKQLPLCNSRTQPLGSETSDALLQNPPLLLHRMSKPGYSQAPLDCTPRMSINFLGPIFPTSPPP